jgi:hypothetical protein
VAVNAAALLLLVLAADANPAPAALEVRLTGEPATGRWVEVTPVSPGVPGKVFAVQDGAGAVGLEESPAGPVMLCTGGDDRATVCERVYLENGHPVTMAGPVSGVRVTGRIRIGRAPAAGARLGFLPDPLPLRRPFGIPLFRKEGRLVKRLTSDPDGRYSVLLAPGRYRLDITTEGGRTEQSESFLIPDPKSLVPPGKSLSQAPPVYDRGDLILEDGLRVEVSATDSAGAPLEGATVGAVQADAEGRFVEFQTLSDARGHAVLSRIDGSKPVSVVCQAAGRLRFEQRFEDVPDSVQCSLPRTPTLQGRVLDAEDHPVASALVALRTDSRSMLADKAGAFLFENLSPGEHTLTIAAPGFRAASREITLAPEERRAIPDIRLEPGELLKGKVVDGVRDEPVPGATVTVIEPPGGGSTVTDEEGGFRLTTGGPVTLEVAADAYPSVFSQADPDRQEEPLLIKVFPGGRIQVTVWDEETDAPCAGCPVDIVLPGGRSWALQTGASGEAASPLLAPGQYQVGLERIRSLGSAVQVQGGDDIRWATVEPERTARVDFGTKATSLQVIFSPPVPEGWALRADSPSRRLLLQPGPDGSFQVRRKRGEDLSLTLQSLSGVQVWQAVVPGDREDAVLSLPLADTQVTGKLLDAEQPMAGEPILLAGMDGSVAAQTRTAGDGAFLVPFLAPGRYHLVGGGAQGRILRSFAVELQHPANLGEVEAQ